MIVDTKRKYLSPETKVGLLKIDSIVCASVTDPFNDPDSEEIW